MARKNSHVKNHRCPLSIPVYCRSFRVRPFPATPTGRFFDNHIWYYLGGLSKYFHIYALNWPDESTFYTGNLIDYSHIVEDFLQSVGVSELYMGGVSAGSYAAVESTLKGTKIRVKALILFSSVMLGITPKEVRTRAKKVKFALRLKPDKLRALIEHTVTRVEFDTAPGSIQQLDIFYVRPYSYYHQLFQAIKNQGDKKQPTLDIPCPTLLLHGTDDEAMPIDLARLSNGRFKNATFIEFKDYKHAMVFTHGPEFIPPIIRFLETSGLLPVSEPSKTSVGATHALP